MACRAGSRLSRVWSEASSSSSHASSASLPRAAPTRLRLRHPGPACLRCYSDAPSQAENSESGASSGPAKNALKEELAGSSTPVTKSELKRAGFLDEAISAEYRATASGKLIRRRIPRATLTLEEFRKLKPRAPKISPMRGKDKRDFEAAKQDAAWQRTFDEISAALGVEQLRQLAKTAGITTSHQAKKTELISVLLKDQFNLLSPQERQRMAKEERVDRRIPVSKTELFLLLVNGGYSLGALAQQTGLTLKPDAKAEEGKAVEYAIIASGQEKALGSVLDEKMQLFREAIEIKDLPLQVRVEALDPAIVRTISARTRTVIERADAAHRGSPGLRLTALSEYDLGQAQLQLAAHQAEFFQLPSPLASYAQPSPLDPAYEDALLQGDLQHFAFLPKATPSVTPWMTEVTLGGEDTPVYRLARVREAGRAAGNDQTSRTFVGLDMLTSSGRTSTSLEPAENWSWLDARLELEPLAKQVDRLHLSRPEAASTTHTLSVGNLVFPGDVTSDDPAVAHLQHLLNPPLSGYWTLDTAFEWLRRRPPLEAGEEESDLFRNPRRPYWINDRLPHLPVDGTGALPAQVAEVVDTKKPAEEKEMLRLVYRLRPSDTGDDSSIWRLHVNVEEKFVSKSHETSKAESAEKVEEAAPPEDEQSPASSEGTQEEGSATAPAQPSQQNLPAVPQHIYTISSAYWTTSREVDVLCPDVPQDLRLSSAIKIPVDTEALSAEPRLYDYLNSLRRWVRRALSVAPPSSSSAGGSKASEALTPEGEKEEGEGEEGQGEDDIKHALHPRHGRVPTPLLHKSRLKAVPPLSFSLLPKSAAASGEASGKKAILHLETVERIATTSYPLLRRSERPGAEAEAEVEEGKLITETSVSHMLRSAKTSSRVEWTSSASSSSSTEGEGEGDSKQDGQSAWQKRLAQVAALMAAR